MASEEVCTTAFMHPSLALPVGKTKNFEQSMKWKVTRAPANEGGSFKSSSDAVSREKLRAI